MSSFGKGMDNLQKLFRSKKKIPILKSLTKGPISLKGLGHVTKSSSSNLIPLINDLKTQNLIKKDGVKYKITPSGKLLLDRILGCINTSALLESHGKYLSTHRFDCLPRQFLKEFPVFSNSRLIGNSVNPFEVLEQISKMLESEKTRILGVSSIVTKEWSDLLIEMARRGIDISLITTENVLKTISNGSFKRNTKEFLSLSNTSLFVNDDIGAGFTVTNQAVLVTFQDKKGSLDIRHGIYCEDKKAVSWGKRLFSYYRRKAVSVDKDRVMGSFMN